jgi:hypothetical protein
MNPSKVPKKAKIRGGIKNSKQSKDFRLHSSAQKINKKVLTFKKSSKNKHLVETFNVKVSTKTYLKMFLMP